MFISQGADVVAAGQPPIESVFFTFLWSLDPMLRNPGETEETLRCMELLGAQGARWRPDRRRSTWMRTTLNRIPPYQAIPLLQRIKRSGIMDQPAFKDLMRTPKMRQLLRQGYPGAVELRRYAGQTE